MIKKIILAILTLVIVLGVGSYFFAYTILEGLWFQSQDFLLGYIRASTIRFALVAVFNIILTAFLFLILSISSSKKRIIFTLIPFVWIFLAYVDYHAQFSANLLSSIFSGKSGSIDPLTQLDMALYLFWLPTLKSGATYFLSFAGVWLILRILLIRKIGLLWFDKIIFILLSISVVILLFSARLSFLKQQINTYIGFMDFYGVLVPTFISLMLFLLLAIWVILKGSIRSRFVFILFILVSVLAIVGNTLVPSYLEQFVYTPNQSTLQNNFAKYHIGSMYSSFDFNIEKSERFLSEETDLPMMISNNFWEDSDHLLRVVQQNQEILPIFMINQSDPVLIEIDQNTVAPFFVAPRESDQSKERDWDLHYFRNVLGYGSVIASVNRFQDTGIPQYVLEDLELNSSVSNFTEKTPQIFFADGYEGLSIINSKMLIPNFTKESYPLEIQNYQGVQGIPVNLFTKILLTIVQRDMRFLFTDYYTENSQILWERQPKKIIEKLLPLFKYSEARANFIDQELWWELDAYAVSDQILNSKLVDTPWGEYNWVRSPLKVFVSAYSGEVFFKEINPDDPYLRVAKRLYRHLFDRQKNIPLHKFNYPKDLFAIQSDLLKTYHNEDPASYYSGLKNLSLARTINDEVQKSSHRFYFEQNRLVLQRSYTPQGKENLAAQVTGYVNDKGKYQLNWYDVPSELGIPGMYQAQNFLNQNTEFSRLATLWGQRGSKISFSEPSLYLTKEYGYYLQTVFLESEALGTPIVAQFTMVRGTQVALGSSLPELAVAGDGIFDNPSQSLTKEEQLRQVIRNAYRLFLEADTARLDGNAQEYQENVDKIGDLLQKNSL